MNNSQIFRPLIQQTPGRPDPTSGDAADLARRPVTGVAFCTTCRAENTHASWCTTVDGRSAQRPDPTKTGPCELKLSFACTGAGYERYDPRDMLAPETSFRTPKISCISCYEMAANHYVKELHS